MHFQWARRRDRGRPAVVVMRHQYWAAPQPNERRTGEIRPRPLREYSLGGMDASGGSDFDCALCFLARPFGWCDSATIRVDDFLRSHNPDDREPRRDYFLYQRLAC